MRLLCASRRAEAAGGTWQGGFPASWSQLEGIFAHSASFPPQFFLLLQNPLPLLDGELRCMADAAALWSGQLVGPRPAVTTEAARPVLLGREALLGSSTQLVPNVGQHMLAGLPSGAGSRLLFGRQTEGSLLAVSQPGSPQLSMPFELALQKLQQQQQQQHVTEAANPLMRGGFLLNFDSRYGSLDPAQLLGASSSLDGGGSAQPLLTAAAAAAAFGSTVGFDMLVDQPVGGLSAGGVSRRAGCASIAPLVCVHAGFHPVAWRGGERGARPLPALGVRWHRSGCALRHFSWVLLLVLLLLACTYMQVARRTT